MRTSIFLTALGALLLASGSLATPAQAATLSIEFSGLDLVYTANAGVYRICDAATCLNGSGIRSESDPLASMTFLVDGNPVGSLNTAIWADVDILLDGPLDASGGSTTAVGGVFDLLTVDADPGWGLALSLLDSTFDWDGSTGTFSGAGSIWAVFDQMLPFGFDLGMPITFSFVTAATSTPVTDTAGQTILHLAASGTGTITGQGDVVPEPGSLLLVGLGLLSSRRALRKVKAAVAC